MRPEGFEALVWTTVINLARNRSRRERLLNWLPLNQTAVDVRTPDRELADQQRDRVIRQALAELPRKQREVILLSLYSGLDRVEQARLLGLAEGTLASRKHTATRKLKSILDRTQ